jgi:hypothetical protein
MLIQVNTSKGKLIINTNHIVMIEEFEVKGHYIMSKIILNGVKGHIEIWDAEYMNFKEILGVAGKE